jgi:hypothetical protein
MKAKFTPEEDARLREVVARCGTNDWSIVAREMFDRKPRQCRERWNNYVNPVLVNSAWSLAEDRLLEAKFNELGARWKEITQFFPTRSKNQVKYRWMTNQKNAWFPPRGMLSPARDTETPPPAASDCRPVPPQENDVFDLLFTNPSQSNLRWGNVSPDYFD